jgi:hypothetical protein
MMRRVIGKSTQTGNGEKTKFVGLHGGNRGGRLRSRRSVESWPRLLKNPRQESPEMMDERAPLLSNRDDWRMAETGWISVTVALKLLVAHRACPEQFGVFVYTAALKIFGIRQSSAARDTISVSADCHQAALAAHLAECTGRGYTARVAPDRPAEQFCKSSATYCEPFTTGSA